MRIARQRRAREETITCPSCAWKITWADYQRTFKRKQFNEGGAGDAFDRFVREYPTCRTPWEKMLAIDLVIHAFHYSLRQDPTQPTRAACVNLIDGKLADVVDCLDEISGTARRREEMAVTHTRYGGRTFAAPGNGTPKAGGNCLPPNATPSPAYSKT